MTDLTDDELRARLKYAMGEHGLEPFVEPLRELQNRRVAVAADKERVRAVVREAALRIANPTLVGHETANAIADRVAEQLAGATACLSAGDVALLRAARDSYARIVRLDFVALFDRMLAAQEGK